MKSFKKALKLACLVLMICLASIGISIAGGAPVPLSRRKENDPQIKIELVESKEETTDSVQIDIKL
ncbi:hypothetical protein SAMN05216490_4274 [Mucilaginibacter mallensis]|uniref:Uncharacterized protein n=1 Tax=Mucilaginibacter mallensis TaxID=652787 RepID=A0A1H2BQX5_MUCMA|nr:hypothetical protein [Mucilaginibacter mallensis]SDT60442.1 hypothetical protein SAMN05216490_4274 [Mucilaginibacter mallensis]